MNLCPDLGLPTTFKPVRAQSHWHCLKSHEVIGLLLLIRPYSLSNLWESVNKPIQSHEIKVSVRKSHRYSRFRRGGSSVATRLFNLWWPHTVPYWCCLNILVTLFICNYCSVLVCLLFVYVYASTCCSLVCFGLIVRQKRFKHRHALSYYRHWRMVSSVGS